MEEKQQIEDLQNQVNYLKNLLHEQSVMSARQQITMYNALRSKYGDEVDSLIKQAHGNANKQAFCQIAKSLQHQTIEDLISVLWEPGLKMGFEYSMENKDNGIQMHCTACPFAELYRSQNAPDLGYLLFCQPDYDIVEGFNPKMGFRRTKTLMEGDSHCDHFYYMIEE
ncbi:MAG: L-2-amino-thiazoline-4-carboxylic acid hydrolase [Ignavibacteria bacterium]|nr:L-2-amino-thiazoline-4-carboxylic acid hydrolase [Ignavibacteria bacterium]